MAGVSRASARTHLRRSRVAQRRAKMRALRVLLGVVVLVALLGAASWLSFLDTFAVQTITVEGNHVVRTRAIQARMMHATANATWGLFSRQNVLLYPRTELEDILAFSFPRIDTVSISRHPMRRSVSVRVVEREPYAQWCRTREHTRECYSVDTEGYVFEKVATTTADMIVFEGGLDATRALRARVAPQYFAQAVRFIDTLRTIGLSVATFVFEGADGRVVFRDGWELRVALDKDMAAVAHNLAVVLDEYNLRNRLNSVRYIDMRFGERVYYTLKGEGE